MGLISIQYPEVTAVYWFNYNGIQQLGSGRGKNDRDDNSTDSPTELQAHDNCRSKKRNVKEKAEKRKTPKGRQWRTENQKDVEAGGCL